MKILYLGNNSFKYFKRGVENVIDFQSQAIDFEKIYYLHWGERTTAYKNNRFTCLSIEHCWYWPLILNLVLFRIGRKNKFIIHSHNPLFSFFSLFNTNIITVHDGLYYLNKSKKRKFLFLFYSIEYLLYFRCKLVHFISNYTKEQSLFGNRRNFVIIPNTSHFEPFVPVSILPEPKLYKNSVLIVRSIEERARFDLLLQVAESLQAQGFRFIVAGKGPLLEHFQKEIQKLNLVNIEMHGYVSDEELLKLYANCDIVLMIAEYGEGFGLPVIEGYLFNKPVLASNKCAIPEVIISNAFLFENTIDNIIGSLTNIGIIDSKNYRQYYNSKFANTIVLSQFKKLYTE